MLFFCGFANTSAVAQQNNPIVCLACSPSLSPITVNTPPNECYRNFTTNAGTNGRCTRMGFEWTTTDPLATINFLNGNALIEFKTNGTHTVCAKFTVGFDRNGDGFISSAEQCTVEECTTVTIDCP